jgi:hypothetical protein
MTNEDIPRLKNLIQNDETAARLYQELKQDADKILGENRSNISSSGRVSSAKADYAWIESILWVWFISLTAIPIIFKGQSRSYVPLLHSPIGIHLIFSTPPKCRTLSP